MWCKYEYRYRRKSISAIAMHTWQISFLGKRMASVFITALPYRSLLSYESSQIIDEATECVPAVELYKCFSAVYIQFKLDIQWGTKNVVW